jgi:uncharacterized protein YndB with AHSA1/START domain
MTELHGRGGAASGIDPIRQDLELSVPVERAFALFTQHLALWWPREYTWGQDVLEEIGIEAREGGRCYEVGPHGFRCDWGRVIGWEPPRRLSLTWQISPRREPQPDPAQASTIEVVFAAPRPGVTRMTFEHRDFERHGAGAREYRDAMASPQGWPWILERYVRAATPDGPYS